MKKKTRKLSLSKKTISNLSAEEMNRQAGENATNGHNFTCQRSCGYQCGSRRTCWPYC